MAAGIITVKHYRFRNDNGSESAATWKGAQDTNIVMVAPLSDTAVRLRLVIQDTGFDVTDTYGLKVSKNGGAAANIGAASSNVKGRVSASLTDGGNTTNQLTLDTDNTYETTAGVVNATAAISHNIVQTAGAPGNETELEWSLVLAAADLAPGNTLDFTIYAVSGVPTVTQFAASNVRITLDNNQPGPNQWQQLWRNPEKPSKSQQAVFADFPVIVVGPIPPGTTGSNIGGLRQLGLGLTRRF